MVASLSREHGLRLPVVRTSLVGRAAERAAAHSFLLDEAVPLLTLTGPGGVGKTRLALAIAHDVAGDFADGIVFVDLTPIREPALVLPAIAQPLGVRDTGERPLADSLATALRPQQLLLVLDNCEQVLDAMPAISDLLAACPALQVLATSRVPLRLRGEQVLPVPPLALPGLDDNAGRLAQNDAVALFVQRARSADPTFALTDSNAATISEICRRLDGLPLALELAAARLRLLSPEALLARLTDRLQVLSGGERDRPDRHRALRDTIAWSYDLLTPDEQTLFRRLAVFAGGCTLEAAETVAGSGDENALLAHPLTTSPPFLDGVEDLVDGSLLTRAGTGSGQPRYSMFETVREFGLEQLAASGEEAAIRDAHAAWCIEFAERTWQIWFGTGRGDDWLKQMTAEHDNVRSALAWLAEESDPTRLLRLAGAHLPFWHMGGARREGREWLERAIDRGSRVSGLYRARVLNGAALLARNRGDFMQAAALAREALPHWGAEPHNWGTSGTWWLLGMISNGQGEFDAATAELNRAVELFKIHGPQWCVESIGTDLGCAELGRGNYAAAQALFEETYARAHARNDLIDSRYALQFLGLTAIETGDAAASWAYYDEAIPLWGEIQPEVVAEGLAGVATVAAQFGSPERSARLFGAAESLRERLGHTFVLPERDIFERARQMVRGRLGERAYEAAFEAGRGLTLEQAIAEAASGEPAPIATVQATADPYGLTPREREVLALLAKRLSDTEIAGELFISPQTASTHVKRVLGKLGVSNRREAAALAVRELPG